MAGQFIRWFEVQDGTRTFQRGLSRRYAVEIRPSLRGGFELWIFRTRLREQAQPGPTERPSQIGMLCFDSHGAARQYAENFVELASS